MSDEVRQAMQTTVDYLDDHMAVMPSQALADTANFLQEMLDA